MLDRSLDAYSSDRMVVVTSRKNSSLQSTNIIQTKELFEEQTVNILRFPSVEVNVIALSILVELDNSLNPIDN